MLDGIKTIVEQYKEKKKKQATKDSEIAWKMLLFHAVFPDDQTYDTVMDILLQGKDSAYDSRHLQWFRLRKAENKYRAQYRRLVKKSMFFDVSSNHSRHLVCRWKGPVPWSTTAHLLDGTPVSTTFLVARPSEIDKILKQAYTSLEESGMTGYIKMYYHLLTVKNVLGITQTTIQKFLETNNYHRLAMIMSKDSTISKPFHPEYPLQRFQVDITYFYLPHKNRKKKESFTTEELWLRQENSYKLSIMTVVDIFSRFTWLKLLPDEKTTTLCDKLQDIFKDGNIPEILQTDNGPGFIASEFDTFLRTFGIRLSLSSPYQPTSNGFVEQKHFTIKSRLYAYFMHMVDTRPGSTQANTVKEFKKQFPLLLQKVQYATNMGVIKHLGIAPLQIHKGFTLKLDWERPSEPYYHMNLSDTIEKDAQFLFPKQRHREDHVKEKDLEKPEVQPSHLPSIHNLQIYDKVRVGIIYKHVKGTSQMIMVYPYSEERVEKPLEKFPGDPSPDNPSLKPLVCATRKPLQVYSWSINTFVIHDIDRDSKPHKYYLRDEESRPVVRLERKKPSQRYVPFFYDWMMLRSG